jgi:hypothetical protein
MFHTQAIYKRHTFCQLVFATVSTLCTVPAFSAEEDNGCAEIEENLSYWEPIYENRSVDDTYADEFALDLVDCLGSENATLRDTYGYGLFSYWLRNDLLRESTKLELFTRLLNNLQDENVLLRSFSALVLSEVLRADAQQPFLTLRDRNQITEQSIDAISAETDFRGLDAELGWIHPVAHQSDVLWRLALHPQLNEKQARQILAAVYNKAVTQQAAYVANESERLARVVVILIRTEILEQSEMLTWLAQFANRQSGEAWNTVFSSPAGMTELHNTKSFVRALADQLSTVEIAEPMQQQLQRLLDTFRQLV